MCCLSLMSVCIFLDFFVSILSFFGVLFFSVSIGCFFSTNFFVFFAFFAFALRLFVFSFCLFLVSLFVQFVFDSRFDYLSVSASLFLSRCLSGSHFL